MEKKWYSGDDDDIGNDAGTKSTTETTEKTEANQ